MASAGCCAMCNSDKMGCLDFTCMCHVIQGTVKETQSKPRNSTFNTILDEMKAFHEKKNHDYAQDSNTYSNFELAAAFANLQTERTFAVLCGIKDAKLTQLLVKGEAKNESIEDTLLDRAIYTVLWLAWRRDSVNNKEIMPGMIVHLDKKL